jgi:dephospho-CoA kinase
MIIGITGSFGSGKTTVANMFSKYGFRVINVDKLYAGIYKKNSLLKNRIKKEFGTINRSRLKRIVFNSSNKLKKLNKITHPLIINSIKKEIITITKNSNKQIPIIKKYYNKKTKIIIDAPLLLETKLKNYINKIIVVKCNKKEQIKRILKKKKYSKKEIENIIKSQMPLKEKIKHADFVVDNSKTMKQSEKQVKAIASFLQKP